MPLLLLMLLATLLPAADLWQVRWVHPQGQRVVGVPADLQAVVIGNPPPTAVTVAVGSDVVIERGPIGKAQVDGKPAVAFRFLVVPHRAGPCNLPAFTFTGADRSQVVVPDPVVAILPQPSTDMAVTIAYDTTAPVWPQQPVPITLTWTLRFPLAQIKALRLDVAELTTPGIRLILPDEDRRDPRPNAIGLPLGARRIVGLREERHDPQGTTTVITCRAHLVADAARTYTFPPAILSCSVDRTPPVRGRSQPVVPSYFNNDLFVGAQNDAAYERVYCLAPERSLVVTPYPTPPLPGFTGLVGRPTLALSAATTSLRVNEPVVLTATITHPHAALVPLPQLADMPAWRTHLRLIDNRSHPVAHGSSVTFSQAVWPLRSETTRLPPLAVPYFDPETRAFAVAESEVLAVTVAEAASDPNALRTADGRILRNPVVAQQGGMHHQEWDAWILSPSPLVPLAWLLFWGAPVAALGWLGWQAGSRRWQATAPARRRRRAASTCRRQLARLPDPAPMAELARLTDAYLVERQLSRNAHPALVAWLQRCDQARFAPRAAEPAAHADLLAVLAACEGVTP